MEGPIGGSVSCASEALACRPPTEEGFVTPVPSYHLVLTHNGEYCCLQQFRPQVLSKTDTVGSLGERLALAVSAKTQAIAQRTEYGTGLVLRPLPPPSAAPTQALGFSRPAGPSKKTAAARSNKAPTLGNSGAVAVIVPISSTLVLTDDLLGVCWLRGMCFTSRCLTA
jgi:hypothetical protein